MLMESGPESSDQPERTGPVVPQPQGDRTFPPEPPPSNPPLPMDGDLADDIYDSRYVRGLFNEMAQTYGVVNLISSFGFAARWRHHCLAQTRLPPGASVVDLMTGMGELCGPLARRVGPNGTILAIDLSPAMCAQARTKTRGLPCPVHVLEGDALAGLPPAGCADIVVSSFGLKTFSMDQQRLLVAEIGRLLRPGGRVSLLEISVPPLALLRWPYLFYIERVIPWIGALFLGNPHNYRMLGVYTRAFGNCRAIAAEFRQAGFDVQEKTYFFGCATGIEGIKREDPETETV